ncbi:hypothetical protein DVA67_007290 [Solirubrobacter sp. CPCC 204708]|uniref:Nuclear transport factor 2 family protein n=1 Tax=Solirubrobacter deserti TaxID=2282478 RepID=A0ABT4RK05_9ACTN|nr:DUF4440 domain-containing protein [Solirubrobacter deserti]MBE2315774.1 hypothetical protein [Solirubrobacter deserti]MDA0138889.1 hypothetical protein [Solirubrobacter deserti]
MTAAARTPEELDTLIEDACLQHDRALLDDLFHDAALLATPGGLVVRGREAVGDMLVGRTYVARAKHVLQVRSTALVVVGAGVHVLGRDGDGTWRAAISFLDLPT